MFYGCTSLQTAPELPATTMEDYCYLQMFRGCTKLNYIKMMATDINAISCFYKWVEDVASIGTFVKNPAMTTLPTGNSGIPSGWTVVDAVEFPLVIQYGKQTQEFFDALYNYIDVNATTYTEDFKGLTLSPGDVSVIKDGESYNITEIYQWMNPRNSTLFSIRLMVADLVYFDIFADSLEMKFNNM